MNELPAVRSYPEDIEARVAELLAHVPAGPVPETVGADLYLDLAENAVRQACAWQQAKGMVGDPYAPPGVETPMSTARYAGALGRLIAAGRCADLLDRAADALEYCVSRLDHSQRTGERLLGADFYLRDVMVCYGALEPHVPRDRADSWRERLSALEPRRLYYGGANWKFYAATGEVLRARYAAGGDAEFVDRMIDSEMPHWTAQAMYRDPHDPVTYDLTVRQNLAMMLNNGYAGRHRDWMRDILHRGALAMLLFVSPTGVAPYGGRSNQFHIMEGMIAYLAEWQAQQELAAGNTLLAGALRRVALNAAAAVRRWFLRDPYFPTKTFLYPEQAFGHDGYGGGLPSHTSYGMLAANLFGAAYHVADESIPPGPAPYDVGGYVLYLAEAFHRLWATAGPYHIEIDTRGQRGHDATGLGRLHKRGVPVETALNMSIVAQPSYRVPVARAERSVALGVGWPEGESWRYLAQADRQTHRVEVEVARETGPVEFTVTYVSTDGGLGQAARVIERYCLSESGLRCTCVVSGASRVRLQVPVIETNGEDEGTTNLSAGLLEVKYAGHRYEVRVAEATGEPRLEPFRAANRNAIYRVAVFEAQGPQISYSAELD